jgi:hypothetical protein
MGFIDDLKELGFIDSKGVYFPTPNEVDNTKTPKNIDTIIRVKYILSQIYDSPWDKNIWSNKEAEFIVDVVNLDPSIRGLLMYGKEMKKKKVGDIIKRTRVYVCNTKTMP